VGTWPHASLAKGMQALTHAPAVVAARLEDVDFLEQVLADVGRPEPAGLAIERHPPDVAQAVRPLLRPCVRPTHEGIILGNGVGQAVFPAAHVNAQDPAEESFEVLAVAEWIAGGAAVTERAAATPVATYAHLP